MQELQLYIESDRLDLFRDETISLTQTIQNVRDIAKVFTSFSKTFSVPASKTNNKIFQHYYNFNIVDGYDARKKKAGRIELNSLPFKTGRIKLEGVTLKNNLAHTYRITFFGNTIELPDLLGDDQLGSLPFSEAEFNLTYSPAEIKAKLQAAATSSIITPLITHTQRLFYDSTNASHNSIGNLYYHNTSGTNGVLWSELKYALRLYEIIEQIEAKYTVANGYANNITFSNDFFSTSNESFYNLYMWLHRKSGNVQPTQQIITYETLVVGYTGTVSQIISGFSTITIPASLVTAPNRILASRLNVNTSSSAPYVAVLQLNGNAVFTSPSTTGNGNFLLPFLVANGIYSVVIQHAAAITFSSIEFEVDGIASGTSYTDTLTVSNLTASQVFDFQIRAQIPEVTIISFLTSLFKMFNLVAYVNDSGVIVVRPLEATSGVDYSYYTSADVSGLDAPINYNISSFADTTQRDVNIALPYKEIIYAYEGTGTFFAKQHNQLFGTNWGALKYIGGTESDGEGGLNYNASTETYKVIAPFEHMKYERLINQNNSQNTTVQWGWSVNENQQPYIGKPLIFYGVRVTPQSNAIAFQSGVSATSSVSTYWIPSNSLYLDPATGKQNINFSLELNEYEGSDSFSDTLFSVYHSEYIIDVFNQSRRLTKITSYLPLRIIYNLKLNDTFTINQSTFIINSITTNLQTGKSEMELLNKV